MLYSIIEMSSDMEDLSSHPSQAVKNSHTQTNDMGLGKELASCCPAEEAGNHNRMAELYTV